MVNEGSLPTLSIQPYRLGWYAPLLGSNLEDLYTSGGAKRPTRYCNGAEFPGGVPLPDSDLLCVSTPPPRRRSSTGPSDGDGDPASPLVVTQDVNFNGRVDGAGGFPALPSSDDWAAIQLNQIGSRRNVGALYTIPNPLVPGGVLDVVGPLSLNLGKGDLGKGDLGKGDLGKGDLGKGDLGKGDLGKGDLGKGDLGKGDLGKGDLGKGDLGGGDLFDGIPDTPGRRARLRDLRGHRRGSGADGRGRSRGPRWTPWRAEYVIARRPAVGWSGTPTPRAPAC